MLYEYEGVDRSADDLARALLLVVAAQEMSGGVAEPIRFSRSHSPGTEPEFTIIKRDDATLYIVTDESVIEAGSSDLKSTVELERASNAETGTPTENTTAKDLVSV